MLSCVLFLFVRVTTAQTCLGNKDGSSGLGGVCGNNVDKCQRDYWCGNKGICEEKIAVGEQCQGEGWVGVCEWGAFCAYPNLDDNADTATLVCIQSVLDVGGTCNDRVTDASNQQRLDCADPLSCSNNVCTRGSYGDTCAASSQCRSNLCEGGVCTQPKDTYTDAGCLNGERRKLVFANFSIGYSCYTPAAPAGAVCAKEGLDTETPAHSCIAGTSCLRITPDDRDNSTCVAFGTVPLAGYCGGDARVCATGICRSNFCTDKRSVYCRDNDDCSSGVFNPTAPFADMSMFGGQCMCGGMTIADGKGIGTCRDHPCSGLTQSATDCAAEFCDGADYTSYNSCYMANCAEKAKASVSCLSGGMMLQVSLLTALFSFFACKLL